MPPPRRRSPKRSTLRIYLPMLLTFIGAAAIVGVLAYAVLPAQADPDSSKPEGTEIAVPTAISDIAMVETPGPIPTQTNAAIDSSVINVEVEATEIPIEPTATAHVIRRPKSTATSLPTQTPTTTSILKPASTEAIRRNPTAAPPLNTRVISFPTAIPASTIRPSATPTRTSTALFDSITFSDSRADDCDHTLPYSHCDVRPNECSVDVHTDIDTHTERTDRNPDQHPGSDCNVDSGRTTTI